MRSLPLFFGGGIDNCKRETGLEKGSLLEELVFIGADGENTEWIWEFSEGDISIRKIIGVESLFEEYAFNSFKWWK